MIQKGRKSNDTGGKHILRGASSIERGRNGYKKGKILEWDEDIGTSSEAMKIIGIIFTAFSNLWNA